MVLSCILPLWASSTVWSLFVSCCAVPGWESSASSACVPSFWHKLRERLRPYLWETAQACVAGNMPMMRPLSFLWPEDEAALACEDEYMLGDALLAAPLLEENANTRQVYLPDGEWIGFFDRKPYQGKQMICTDCDGKIPVFIRSGYEKQF